jgi:hypothetical protein
MHTSTIITQLHCCMTLRIKALCSLRYYLDLMASHVGTTAFLSALITLPNRVNKIGRKERERVVS